MLTALDLAPDSLDDSEQNFAASIREYGWFRTAVFAEGDSPGFAYTTGFWLSAGVPEVVTFSMNVDSVHQLYWNLFRDAKEGRAFPVGRRTDAVFENVPAYLFPLGKAHYREYPTWTSWFYRRADFPCVQLVWPDRAGLFPWEEGFDERLRSKQPDLSENGWHASIVD